MRILTYYGAGAWMNEATKTENDADANAYNVGDLEKVLQVLIDNDEIMAELATAENVGLDEEDGRYIYIDNTGSSNPEKAHCYYCYIDQLRFIE